MRTLGPGARGRVRRSCARPIPGADGGDAWRLLESTYRPDARFGEAFCRLMVGLLGARAPLLVDAMLPALKQAQRPWLARAVERRLEICDRLGAQAARVTAAGHSLQVEDDRIAAPLFVLHGRERRRVLWDGPDRYLLRGAGDGAATGRRAARAPSPTTRPWCRPACCCGRWCRTRCSAPRSRSWARASSPTWRRPRRSTPCSRWRRRAWRCGRRCWCSIASSASQLDEPRAHARAAPARRAIGVRAARSRRRLSARRVAARCHARRARCAEDRLHGARPRPRAPVREDARADRRALELFAPRRARPPCAATRRCARAPSRCARPVCPAARRRSACLSPRTSRCGTASRLGSAVMGQLDVESDAVQIVDPEAAP